MMEVNNFKIVPFGGFYGSLWADTGDWEAFAEERGITLVDEWDVDWEGYEADLGPSYVGLYGEDMKKAGFKAFRLRYDCIVSPKYYNFSTDTMWAVLELDDPDGFFGYLKEKFYEFEDCLRDIIKDEFSSRDGFMSFMDDTFEEWIQRLDARDEDYVPYAVYMVMYCMTADAPAYFDEFGSELDNLYYEVLSCNGTNAEQYMEPCTDSARDELKAIEEREAEKAWDAEHQLSFQFTY